MVRSRQSLDLGDRMIYAGMARQRLEARMNLTHQGPERKSLWGLTARGEEEQTDPDWQY